MTIDIEEIRNLLQAAQAADEKARPHYVSAGEHLLEARCQLTHKQFRNWIKRNFGMSIEQAEEYMDLAYRARRTNAED